MESGGWRTATTCKRDGWTRTGRARKPASKLGDFLVAVDGRTITNVGSLEQQIYGTGVWSKTTYSLVRQGIPVEAPLILVPADRTLYIGLRLIALVYLGIGLYVLLRRWTAPKSTHFYIFCLVSFIFYSFHYTGKLNDFDWIIYWANVAAWMLQPALFLHFALTFPERQAVVEPSALADSGGLCARGSDPGHADCGACNGCGRARHCASTLTGCRWSTWRATSSPRRLCFGTATAMRHHADSAAADEVGHARDPPGHGAFHDVLCHPLPVRERADARRCRFRYCRWSFCR